jgi:hypothetical protein
MIGLVSHTRSCQTLLHLGQDLRLRVSKLPDPRGFFSRWRERRAGAAVEAFAASLEALSAGDVQRFEASGQRQLVALTSGVVDDLEAHLGRYGHRPRGTAQALATSIYRLQRCVELLSRGATPNPAIEDVQWEMRTHPTADRPSRRK